MAGCGGVLVLYRSEAWEYDVGLARSWSFRLSHSERDFFTMFLHVHYRREES